MLGLAPVLVPRAGPTEYRCAWSAPGVVAWAVEEGNRLKACGCWSIALVLGSHSPLSTKTSTRLGNDRSTSTPIL